MNRKLSSNLKILKPYHDTYYSSTKVRESLFGDKVWIRNYGQSDKWIQGVILARKGPISYKISYQGGEAKRHIDQLRKRSDKIEFHDVPLPNPQSVAEETTITSNIPKLSPPTESTHNGSKDNMSTESPGLTPNTQNKVNKPNTPPSNIPLVTATPTLEPTPASNNRPPPITTPTQTLKPTPALNTRQKRNTQQPS